MSIDAMKRTRVATLLFCSIRAGGDQLVIGIRTGTALSKPVQAMVDAGLIKIVHMKMEGR